MNDDAFLDLFALDLPDLTFCIPNPCEAVETWPCPPVMGGAPAWWDDLWDFLGDIWGGAGDLAEKIGKSFSQLWDKIWGWVGGTVRWLYNQFWGLLDWLKTTAIKIWDTAYDILHRIVYWLVPKLTAVWDTVYDTLHRFVYWLVPKLTAVWDTVYDILNRVAHAIPDKLTDIWDTVYDILNRVAHAIPDKLTDIWDTVYDILNHVAHAIPDTLTDIWDFVRIDLWGHVSGAAAGIGQAVTDAFGDFVEMVKKGLSDLGDALGDAIKWPWDHIMEPFKDIVERKVAIAFKLVRHQYTRLEEILADALDPPIAFGITAFAGLILVLIFMQAFSSCWRAYVEPLFEVELQDQRGHVGRELLTVGVVQEALNRGFISEAEANFHLEKAGYGEPAKHALLELRNLLPGPSDLVRFGVREVFTPEIAERFGQYEDYPEGFTKPMALQGYSLEWARSYWAAHWDLPSAGQGFEMMHRRVITEDDLRLLLRALDVMPFWRDKLMAISYNPITRVDLRRLYKLKIITEEQVFDGYRDLGYNDEKARWLTEFTKQFAAPDEEGELKDFTDMAASTIRTAYRRHTIDRAEATDKLMDVGYTEDVADFLLTIDDAQLALNPLTDMGVPVRDLTVPIIRTAYAEKLWARDRAQQELEALGYLAWEADLLLQLEDLAQQRELAGLQEAVVKELYLANAIDKAQAGAQLDAVDVLPERRDLLLQRWELQKAQKPKRLTLAQLQTGFRKGILSEGEFLDAVSALGYNDADAQFILAII